MLTPRSSQLDPAEPMPRRPTLQQRWFLLASSLGLGTALIGSAFFIYSEYQHRLQDLHNFAAILTRSIAVEAPHLSDTSTLSLRLAVAGVDPLIDRACLFDDADNLLASWSNPGTQAPACTPAEATFDYLRPSSHLDSADTSIRVDLLVERSRLTGVILQLATPTMIALIVILIGVLVIARLLARSALRPISRLTESAVNFNPQAPVLQAVDNAPTEVTRLATAFNRVIDTLLEAKTALEGEIMQRKTAEQAERGASDLLRNIVDLVPSLIFARNEQGALLFANEAVARLYDTTLEALLDGSFHKGYTGLRPDGLLFSSSFHTTHAEEVWFTDTHGDMRRFLISQVPYQDGQARLVIGVDVTEEHRLQMQLQFSQRLEVIGTLAGGIAHDFNNLLTPILGYTSMLLDMPLSEDIHTKLRAMENAANRARDVVHQILTFSRQQQTIPMRTPIDAGAIVREAVALMQASIPSSVRIEEDIQPSGMVAVDPNQLHQVIVNLCTNSAQAIKGSAGLIKVSLRQIDADSPLIPVHAPPAPFACIEVADNGRGMPRDVIGHIFEPFFTTKNVGEGSGLGLSVVHGIVTAHGGEITVESEERRGSTFRVLLPLAARTGETPSRGISILLVDDERSVLQVTGELLTSQGFDVASFTDPQRALDAFQRKPAAFDVLVTDHNMPAMTGAELSRAIRAIKPELPIILITGFASSSVDELIGIDHKIMKPISGRELSMVIQQCVTTRHSTA